MNFIEVFLLLFSDYEFIRLFRPRQIDGVLVGGIVHPISLHRMRIGTYALSKEPTDRKECTCKS